MKPQTVHVARVLMFSGILLSIHWQHRKFVRAALESASWSDVMPAVRDLMPAAAEVRSNGEWEPAEILDASEAIIGSVIRTSPMADHVVGFSGSTDVIVIFDKDGVVRAANVISSRDTRDHVQQVLEDPTFLNSLKGRTQNELLDLRHVDAVSGATLTSYAILESIQLRVSHTRLGDKAVSNVERVASLKFPDPPRLEDVRLLYPAATTLERVSETQSLWRVLNADRRVIGSLLRTSPSSDNVVGYQGPTDVLIAFDSSNLVTGIAIGVSYDNEPYVGYVREDKYFRELFNGRNLLALNAIESGEVEGVSGATMTSQSAARSIQIAAQALVDEQNSLTKNDAALDADLQARPQDSAAMDEPTLLTRQAFSAMLTQANISTLVMTMFGVVLGLTRLRGRRWLRIGFQVILIGWLGLMNGDLVSQASLLGWTQNGIPWQHALGLTTLTFAALLVPITTRRNVYCSHICPHGAVQQLIRRRLPWQWKMSPWVNRQLQWIPGILTAWVVAIGLLHLPFSPVDIEPFDAWLWTIAGTATIVVAVVGLVVSAFVPMAYCRFGCPTGAVLDFVGSAHGKTWGRKDTITLTLLVLGFLAMIFSSSN